MSSAAAEPELFGPVASGPWCRGWLPAWPQMRRPGHKPRPVSGHSDLGMRPGSLHVESASRTGANRTLDKPYSSRSKALFLVAHKPTLPSGESRRLVPGKRRSCRFLTAGARARGGTRVWFSFSFAGDDQLEAPLYVAVIVLGDGGPSYRHERCGALWCEVVGSS